MEDEHQRSGNEDSIPCNGLRKDAPVQCKGGGKKKIWKNSPQNNEGTRIKGQAHLRPLLKKGVFGAGGRFYK